MGTHYRGSSEATLSLDVYIKLIRCAETVSTRMEQYLAKDGLTISQFGVLEALYHLGPQPQNKLCGKLLKSGGNISTVVRNLEKRGLIERNRDPDDRRVLIVILSHTGHELVEKVFPKHVTRIKGELEVLSVSEKRALGNLCRKLGLSVSKNIDRKKIADTAK